MDDHERLRADCATALAIVTEWYDRPSAPLFRDEPTVPPCRYVDVSNTIGHERAQAALRALELDGEIVWLASGVLFPNRFPWSSFARRTLARGDDSGPARGTSGRAADPVRPDPAAGRRRA